MSGRGSNMSSIIKTCRAFEWPIEVLGVIADKKCEATVNAEKMGVRNKVVNREDYKPVEFQYRLSESIKEVNPDLIVLAGFMVILKEQFFHDLFHIMVNIHPSLLPKFPGLNTHKRALESKETVHGASVHSVIGPVDSGPIICQGKLNIRSNDNPESLGIRVLKIEHMIFPMAVGAVLSGKVRLVDDKWTISNHLNDSWYKADFKENYDFSDCGFSS